MEGGGEGGVAICLERGSEPMKKEGTEGDNRGR